MAIVLKIFTELDNRVFVPGEEISGRVEWSGGVSSVDPSKQVSAEVRLFFYTSGKGSRDVEIVATQRMEGIGASGESEFCMKIPEASPPSFSGQLVSLEWALEFQIEESGETERCEITVSPTGAEIALYKYDDGNLPHSTDLAIGGMRKKQRK